jgi:hypothetical protein
VAHVRVTLAAVSGLLALLGGVHCILPCNDIACDGGFEWLAAPAAGALIPPGEYVLEIVVEGTPHEIVCTIAAGLQESECSQAVTPDGESDFDLYVDLGSRHESEIWNPDAPIESIRMSIADNTDRDDEDRTQSIRGPEEIEITVTLGDRVLVEQSFAPEYVRDEDFWGDERCGYCDERSNGASTWVP